MAARLCSKVQQANKLILDLTINYKNLIIASSFGKDSMVMLDLFKRLDIKLPILFHREPFFPKKYSFANSIIEQEEYTVYDYSPSATTVIKNGKTMEIVNYYQVGPSAGVKTPFSYLPTGIKESETALCGYKDIYQKTVGTYDFPWDLCFVGHKSSDVDPILGAVPLLVDVKQTPGGADYAFPLRYFTNEDIWEYTEKYNVPFNSKRYNKAEGYKEFEDLTYNNDYFEACTKCMDKDMPESVFCPKLQHEISNISSKIRYQEPPTPEYIGTNYVI